MIQSDSGFIAAIDLGTSKITGVVGRKNENNVISVLACETIPSDRCIRRGVVYNIEETGAKVRKLINLLENKLGRKIGKVYVPIAGQSLRSVDFRERMQLSSSGIVTTEIIAQLHKEAAKYHPEMAGRYAIADVEYFLDGKPEKNPVGITCSVIEANYKMIVGRPNIIANIQKSIRDRAQVDIAGYTVGALASASIALNEEEKELGCAFIDFGGGTTTLSIYKGGILRRMVVIPFGGRTITKDICELNFIESDAEQYKIKFGKAHDNQDNLLSSPFFSKPDIDLVELNKVIRMRLDEIVANVKEQIVLSGYDGQLGAGIVMTGGVSQLKNLDIYLTEKLKMPVRQASAKKSYINNFPELAGDPSLTCALGLLRFGTEDCEKKPVTQTTGEGILEGEPDFSANTSDQKQKGDKKKPDKNKEVKKRADSFFSRMGDILGEMFSEDENK
ncbi:MAG: cell division protein FtsA [Dysgonamonadaceae bacterium]|jgi:cell division protein FtsA|nr:cell division protein FtsA [Dysgonamonadaceae bacterium]